MCMDQQRQSLTLDVYLIDMFTTILRYKPDQIKKLVDLNVKTKWKYI